MRKPPYTPSGIWLLDKPVGMSSRLLLNQFYKKFGIRDAGHTGTLDPLAEGLLVVVTGTARRVQDLLCHGTKCYHACIRLGATSATDDAEGPITAISLPNGMPSYSEVSETVQSFVGTILQTPPAYSAIKIDGKRAYKLARDGKTPEIKPRIVNIYSIQFVQYTSNELEVQVICSAGTYIRSLARDIGKKLNCGGYIQTLRRLSAEPFSIQQAKTLDTIQESDMISLDSALSFYPRLELPDNFWFAVRNGQPLFLEKLHTIGIGKHLPIVENVIWPIPKQFTSLELENNFLSSLVQSVKSNIKNIELPYIHDSQLPEQTKNFGMNVEHIFPHHIIIYLQGHAVALACKSLNVVQVQRMLLLDLPNVPSN